MASTIFKSYLYVKYDCDVSFAEDHRCISDSTAKLGWQKYTVIVQTLNFHSHFHSCKILAVPEMNSNVIQTEDY